MVFSKEELLEKIDKIRFNQIFIWWIILILGFGIIYFVWGVSIDGLIEHGTPIKFNFSGLGTSIYFSFITALSVGYGDVIPVGIVRLFSTLEAIMGLLIFGVIISKLVSVKQEHILEEIYEISFTEKIQRLRSAMYLFRSDIDKTIANLNEKKIDEKKLKNSWLYVHSLSSTFSDTISLLNNSKGSIFTKKVDFLNFELILNSIRFSLDKLNNYLDSIKSKRKVFEKKTILEDLGNIYGSSSIIYHKYDKIDDPKIKNKLSEIKNQCEKIKQFMSLLDHKSHRMITY